MWIAIGLLAALVLLALFVIGTYNGLVGKRNAYKNAFAQIDVQLKRRYDLIPNLVETVKGYMKHEAGTLEAVTRARNEAMANNGAPHEQAQSENMLSGALKSLFALAESYPDLKANTNFLDLQQQLADVENNIQAARRYYNGCVRDNNTKIDQFPSNLVARKFSFEKAEFFELDESESAARNPVPVSFS